MNQENLAHSQNNSADNQVDGLELKKKPREMSGKILNIGEYLINQPEVADLLFFEYAQLTDKAEQAAEEMSRLYNEIFFEKQIDKNEVISAILRRASKLLADAEEKLKDTQENDKRALVRELIEELIKEQMALRWK